MDYGLWTDKSQMKQRVGDNEYDLLEQTESE